MCVPPPPLPLPVREELLLLAAEGCRIAGRLLRRRRRRGGEPLRPQRAKVGVRRLQLARLQRPPVKPPEEGVRAEALPAVALDVAQPLGRLVLQQRVDQVDLPPEREA